MGMKKIYTPEEREMNNKKRTLCGSIEKYEEFAKEWERTCRLFRKGKTN